MLDVKPWDDTTGASPLRYGWLAGPHVCLQSTVTAWLDAWCELIKHALLQHAHKWRDRQCPLAMPELMQTVQYLMALPLAAERMQLGLSRAETYLPPCCAADLKALEEEVRAIHKDGLLWGAGAPCACLPVVLRYSCLLISSHELRRCRCNKASFGTHSGCLSDRKLAYIFGGLLHAMGLVLKQPLRTTTSVQVHASV